MVPAKDLARAPKDKDSTYEGFEDLEIKKKAFQESIIQFSVIV